MGLISRSVQVLGIVRLFWEVTLCRAQGTFDSTRRAILKGIGLSAVRVARGTGAVEDAGTSAQSRAEARLPANALVISAQRPAVIAIPQDNQPVALSAARRLADYIRRVTGVEPQIHLAGEIGPIDPLRSS